MSKKTKLILLLAVVIVSAILYFRPPVITKTFAGITSSNTMKYRLWAWDIALKGFWDRPIVGVGHGNYLISFNKHYNPLYQEKSSSVIWYDNSHNFFLGLLTETGLLGFSAFMLFMFVLFKKLWKHPQRLILLPLFIAYFTHLFFLFPTINCVLIFLLIVAYVSKTE